MEIKIKKLTESAVLPRYSKEGDAGMDLTATRVWSDDDGNVCYGTGLAFEIPRGYVGLLFPRSSNAKKDLLLANSVGVLDSDFRGEVMLKFKPQKQGGKMYEVGERVAQVIILPYPYIEFKEVDELSETNRGEGGFGSTGK